MKSAYTYIPSKLVAVGEGEFLRQHAFTRWVSPDLNQVACGLGKSLALIPIYVESSPENLRRSLLWHPPEGCAYEVRSGRTRDQFVMHDDANIDRGWALLSLHVNECAIYSAVWVSSEAVKVAHRVLAGYGITPASRMLAT